MICIKLINVFLLTSINVWDLLLTEVGKLSLDHPMKDIVCAFVLCCSVVCISRFPKAGEYSSKQIVYRTSFLFMLSPSTHICTYNHPPVGPLNENSIERELLIGKYGTIWVGLLWLKNGRLKQLNLKATTEAPSNRFCYFRHLRRSQNAAAIDWNMPTTVDGFIFDCIFWWCGESAVR